MGGRDEPYAIKIDEKLITHSEFQVARRAEEERFRAMLGENYGRFAEQMLQGLNERLVDQLIAFKLLHRESSDQGFYPGEKQLIDLISRQLAVFGSDRERALAFLRQMGDTKEAFAEKQKPDAIREQLLQLVNDSSLASDREVRKG